jgi:hypothetical protein
MYRFVCLFVCSFVRLGGGRRCCAPSAEMKSLTQRTMQLGGHDDHIELAGGQRNILPIQLVLASPIHQIGIFRQRRASSASRRPYASSHPANNTRQRPEHQMLLCAIGAM